MRGGCRAEPSQLMRESLGGAPTHLPEAQVKLPDAVNVQLQATSGSVLDLANILVAFDLHHQGRYYYGGLVGLTDPSGATSLTGSNIEQAFAADCRAFPMDYKVPLSDCDPLLVIRIEGGSEFLAARRAGIVRDVVPESVMVMWDAARNASFRSTSCALNLEPGSSELCVFMALELTSS